LFWSSYRCGELRKPPVVGAVVSWSLYRHVHARQSRRRGEDLDLSGQIDGARLAAVLEGRDPLDGVRLVRTRSDRVPGFDLTFRAPKSVSVLFRLAALDVAGEVRAAHDLAVDAALGFSEREACGTRRGTDGVDAFDGAGFVGAAFRHRTSRAATDHQVGTQIMTSLYSAALSEFPAMRQAARQRRARLEEEAAGVHTLFGEQLDELSAPVRRGERFYEYVPPTPPYGSATP
jgi:hypothetical protein